MTKTLEERIIEMALNDCKTRHGKCENCNIKCMWRDEPQIEREERNNDKNGNG